MNECTKYVRMNVLSMYYLSNVLRMNVRMNVLSMYYLSNVLSMYYLSKILMSQKAGIPTTWRSELYDVVCSCFDICKVLLPSFRHTAVKILTE